MIRTGLLLSLLTCSSITAAQVGKLYPIDEAAEDPAFYVYRLRLLQAVAVRDTNFLYAQMAPQIKLSFGGDAGVEDFRRRWQPDNPQSRIWSVLAEILAGGGAFRGPDHFAAPYWTSDFPGHLDAFDYGVVIGSNVNVREAPDLGAPVLTQLSFDIVKVLDWYAVEDSSDNGPAGWIAIELTGSRKGFIAARYLRGATGYRIGFEKLAGRWVMRWFLAGD